MAVNTRLEQAYGFGQGIYQLSPKPIVAQRAPTPNDKAEVGTIWCDEPTNAAYILTSIVANQANWQDVAGGTGDFTALTVNPGPSDLTGDLTVTSAVTSTVAINAGTGGISEASTGRIDLNSSFLSATAVRIRATNAAGGVAIASGTNGVSISSVGGDVSLSSDDAADNAITLEALDAAGGITMDAANSTVTLTMLDGGTIFANTDLPWAVETGTGDINIGVDNTASNINIGTGATATKAIHIGDGATGVNAVTIGSSNAGSTVTLNVQSTTAGVLIDNGTHSASIFVGDADPNGSITGTDGSIYLRTGTGTASTILYVCTGAMVWTAVTVP